MLRYLIGTACLMYIGERIVIWRLQYREHRLMRNIERIDTPKHAHTPGERLFGYVFASAVWAIVIGAIALLDKLFP